MAILELALTTYGIVGTTASVIGGITLALKRFSKITAEDIFRKCLDDAVKEYASSLVGFTETRNPQTIRVDTNKFDSVIASLKDTDITELRSLKESERLTKITALFRDCITLPYHQLTDEDLEQKLLPVFEKTIVNFYRQLPLKQEAFNQIVLGFIENNTTNQANAHALLTDLSEKVEKTQLEVQERLTKDLQTIKNDTEIIKNNTDEIKETSLATRDLNRDLSNQVSELTNAINRHLNISIPDDVAAEHQSVIDNARELLNKGKPESSLDLLKNLEQRIWENASTNLKFAILTNMAAAQHVLNEQQEAAALLIDALQYNPENEKALSNCALAYFLLGETSKAAEYAKQALEKNPTNADAYVVLVEISTDEETLENVIDKVPKDLREIPQVAYAISDIAKQRGNLEEARKWREIMVAQEQNDASNYKAALAAILIEQVLANDITVFTKQLDDTQKKELQRATQLLTEAWNSVVNTELHSVRTDWIINRSMAYRLLDESELGIKDLDAALEIEPSHPILLKNRALLTFEQGKKDRAIEFLEKIESVPEASKAQILIATILFEEKRFDEAIKRLNDFLAADPSSKLREEANRWLVRIYIAKKCFEEAEQISKAMCESSPTNILNLVDAARIFSATEKRDEALSKLKEAYNYAQNSKEFLEIVELADELYNHQQYKEAATLYEKLADTSQNSQLTLGVLASYYNAGEIGKALEICQELREKYGPLENISEREVIIYEEIGDMNQAEAVCKAYLNEFPNDVNMQIRLGFVYYRSNKEEKIDNVLESFSDSKNYFFLKNLSLEACVQLAHLYQIRSAPEKALQIMYETRRMHFNNPDAHLKYIGLSYQVEKQIPEVLNPTQVQVDTMVQIDSSDRSIRYIIVDRDDVDITRGERHVNDDFVKQLLGKIENDKVDFGLTLLGQKTGKIAAIKSKYVHARQESFEKYPELFPTDQGLGSITLDDSNEIDDSERFQPLFDVINRRHETFLQIEQDYKENPLPIGTLINLIGGNVLDTWGLLTSKSDLGIRCCVGDSEEKKQALALFEDSQPKLAVDLISLITLHCLEAADVVVKTFGKLTVAQSTVDEFLQIIYEREGMWSEREGMTVGKQGDRYVKQIINPEDAKHSIEYFKGIVKWIKENCEVEPCTAALQINQLRKRKLDDMLQPLFLDTVLIASQAGYLLFSDDGRLRSYAKTSLNNDAGTNLQIEGVWTQVVLEHCVKKNLLDKADYDKMTTKLVCSHYYGTTFDADLLTKSAEQSDWQPSELYNSLVQALGGQRMNLHQALNVTVKFLFQLWQESIPFKQREFLTLVLLAGLTSERMTKAVLNQLADRIRERYIIYMPTQNDILRQIRAYKQIYPLENNFEFLSEDDIRIKGTRVGIETVLSDYIHDNQTPEAIADRYYTLTLEQVYATILYHLQNREKIDAYLEDYLEYCLTAREEYEKNPPPEVVRLRQLKAERQNVADNSHPDISKNSSANTTSSSRSEQE